MAKVTNYIIGRRLEYKIMDILRKALNPKKYTIIRTAGSHSPVDIFVFEHRQRRGFGIQCKSKISRKKT